MANENSRRRAFVALGLAGLVAISAGVTWVASGQIRSPGEVAARTVAPEPSPILVPVEMRIISSDIVTRGTGRFGSPQTLSVVPSNLRQTASYIDSTPLVGATLVEGDVALVASGRPVIIMQGALPGHRDLGPGMEGSDVLQFEQALDRLGFTPGKVDGTYDEATELAVALWYYSLGYEPQARTAQQLESIRVIEADLSIAERESLAAAESAAVAESELAAASEEHRIALLAVEQAQQAVLSAQAEADAAIAGVAAEARAAELEAEQAWIQIPAAFDSAEESQAALFNLEMLRSAAATAQAKEAQVRAAGEDLVRAAERELAAAPGAVASAARALKAARTRNEISSRIVDLSVAPAERLEHDLATFVAGAGIQVPVDEIIFVPETPVRVAEVHIRRGDLVEGPLLTVSNAVVAIDGALALDQVSLVEPGMQVQIDEPDLGINAQGTVSFVADGPGTRGADGFHVYFETLVTDSAASLATIAGASVRLTLSVESSGGAVLAVPASALTLAVDGSSQLLVQHGPEMQNVTVEPGLAAAGYVAIDSPNEEVNAGDLVVIGFEQRGIADG